MDLGWHFDSLAYANLLSLLIQLLRTQLVNRIWRFFFETSSAANAGDGYEGTAARPATMR